MKPLLPVLALVAMLNSLPVGAKTISGTASVVDGDTIEIHGQRIRLSAIDAIESRQPCLLPGGKEWNCGRDAAMALSDRIGRAPLTCAVSGTDRYGRSVAVCKLAGADIGAWMVENGWAVAYRRYGTEYVSAERRPERGSWHLGQRIHDALGLAKGAPMKLGFAKLSVALLLSSHGALAEPPTVPPNPLDMLQDLRFASSWSCSPRQTCKAISSCEEAIWLLQNCSWGGALDRDDDGVPCETICPGG